MRSKRGYAIEPSYPSPPQGRTEGRRKVINFSERSFNTRCVKFITSFVRSAPFVALRGAPESVTFKSDPIFLPFDDLEGIAQLVE